MVCIPIILKAGCQIIFGISLDQYAIILSIIAAEFDWFLCWMFILALEDFLRIKKEKNAKRNNGI